MIKIEVIDGLRTIARNLTNDILQHVPVKTHRHFNDFKNGVTHHLPHYEIREEDIIKCMLGTRYAIIEFKNIRVKEITEMQFSDPVQVDKSVNPAKIDAWRNNSKTPMKRALRHASAKSVKETHTSSTEFGFEVTHSLRTKVGGSIMIADAEVEQSLTFQTNFTQRFESQTEKTRSQEREENLEITIPAYTETTFMQTKTISDWHQTVRTAGVLDADIYIGSHGDFCLHLSSLDELQSFIQGHAVPGQDWKATEYFRSRKFKDYVIDTSPLEMAVENTFTYRDLHISDVERMDVDLPTPKKTEQAALSRFSNEQILIEAYRRDLL